MRNGRHRRTRANPAARIRAREAGWGWGWGGGGIRVKQDNSPTGSITVKVQAYVILLCSWLVVV